MPHLSNSAEALHWDEASAKLTNVLKRLNGVGQGRIEWIERASYPRTDAPAPTMRSARLSTTERCWSPWQNPWRPCRKRCGR
jgi:hypothetical protein